MHLTPHNLSRVVAEDWVQTLHSRRQPATGNISARVEKAWSWTTSNFYSGSSLTNAQ